MKEIYKTNFMKNEKHSPKEKKDGVNCKRMNFIY